MGEDVIYDAEEQLRFQAAGASPRARRRAHAGLALGSGSRACTTSAAGGSRAPRSTSRCGRTDCRSHEVLGREPRPVTFVVSTSLPDGEGRAPALVSGTRFKLDPEADWTRELVAELVDLDAVDVVDFKEAYDWRAHERTPPAEPLPARRRRAPGRLIEDPDLIDPEKAAILEPHRDRISWDAPIHSVADVDALAFRAEGAELQAVAVRLVSSGSSTSTTRAPSGASGSTAVASSSSGPGAARSSTSPRCSTRTRRTTSRRASTTASPFRRDCPRARCRRRRSSGFGWLRA